MPNHCANKLVVTGNNVAEFVEFAKGKGKLWDIQNYEITMYRNSHTDTELSDEEITSILQKENEKNRPESLIELHNFLPVPNSVSNYSDAGYCWCNDNWGTKWGCYDIEIVNQSENMVEYQFNTAWSPFSQNVMEAMVEKFPDLEFQLDYFEIGAGYVGRMVGNKDGVSDETCYIPDDSPIYSQDEDGEDWEGCASSVDIDGNEWETCCVSSG